SRPRPGRAPFAFAWSAPGDPRRSAGHPGTGSILSTGTPGARLTFGTGKVRRGPTHDPPGARGPGLPGELRAQRVLRGPVAGHFVVTLRVVEHDPQVRVDVVVQADDPAADPAVEVTVAGRVVARGQLPQPLVGDGSGSEHAGAW